MSLRIDPGPRLLSAGPSLASHRSRFGALPILDVRSLVAAAGHLRGRGGAGFPFATKLSAVADRHRPVLVVNWSEGEPASHKDLALAMTAPHLVLDGVCLVARALGVRTVHLVVNAQLRPYVERAVAERGRRPRFVVHQAAERFVAGQARAVIELMSGRENLPVTAWQPEGFSGYRGRPTLLSNAETWAQLAAFVMLPETPETTLLTINGSRVCEVSADVPWTSLVPEGPVLIGGYHGVWARCLAGLRVDRDEMAARGLPLGAGVVLPLGQSCPVHLSARIASYLAKESAGRCGPCFNGLPALADALRRLASGQDTLALVEQLCGMVTGRGACAHPDGTARMARSLLTAFPDEIAAHRYGACTFVPTTVEAHA